MPLDVGDKVEIIDDQHPHKGKCGVVTDVLPQSGDVIVRITHDKKCNPITPSFLVGPLPPSDFTACHCP
jgi:ribosomal protein L24